MLIDEVTVGLSKYVLLLICINLSGTKPLGTHTLYQGGGEGDRPEPSAILKTVAPKNLKCCRALETSFNVLEMLKLFA